MTTKELIERQNWSLQQKIDHSLGAIDQFYSRLDGKVYVSFSGGKDSTVLLDLCRIIDPNIKAVFCNTGNEYPDIVKFVRKLKDTDGYNIEIIRPSITPKEVIASYAREELLMFGKLEATEKRYESINKDLCDPDIISDQNKYKELMKEYKNLSPIVEKYKSYKQ